MSSVYEISSQEQYNQLMSSQYDVVVMKVGAEWCGACKTIKDFYGQLASAYSSPKVIFVYINADLGLVQGVRGLPTFLIYVKGQQYDQVLGANKKELQDKLVQILGNPPQQVGQGDFNNGLIRGEKSIKPADNYSSRGSKGDSYMRMSDL